MVTQSYSHSSKTLVQLGVCREIKKKKKEIIQTDEKEKDLANEKRD